MSLQNYMTEGEPLPDDLARIYRLEGLPPDEQWRRAAEIHTIMDRMNDYAPVLSDPDLDDIIAVMEWRDLEPEEQLARVRELEAQGKLPEPWRRTLTKEGWL